MEDSLSGYLILPDISFFLMIRTSKVLDVSKTSCVHNGCFLTCICSKALGTRLFKSLNTSTFAQIQVAASLIRSCLSHLPQPLSAVFLSELVRGKSARIIGSLTTVLVLCKGLPSAYNRDLQVCTGPLMRPNSRHNSLRLSSIGLSTTLFSVMRSSGLFTTFFGVVECNILQT